MSILKQLRSGIECPTAADTQAVAAALAAVLPEDTVLALHGDLGAGKTTFVQGLARTWGIAQAVTSPTFAIYAPYQGQRNLMHMDAYRLTDAGEGEELLVEELLESPWCLAVEWPERVAGAWWMQGAWELRFTIGAGDIRKITLDDVKK